MRLIYKEIVICYRYRELPDTVREWIIQEQENENARFKGYKDLYLPKRKIHGKGKIRNKKRCNDCDTFGKTQNYVKSRRIYCHCVTLLQN